MPPTLSPGGIEYNLQHDDAYCANHLLFDDWFVSSIAPLPNTIAGSGTSKDITSFYKDFLAGDEQLANRAYRKIPADTNLTSSEITERAQNCIILSLGSGPHAHGQLLIYHDLFGLYPKFTPRMAKQYGNAGEVILHGLRDYVAEVGAGQFPQPENYFGMKDDEYEALIELLQQEH